MKNRTLHLIAYDISKPKCLRAALKATRDYATGGQQSVHECWMTDAERGDLLATLSMLIDESTDSLICIHLDTRQQVITLGKAKSPNDTDLFYIG
ncbi:CRISPR-associated endonuclease Cas2 [Leucothrix arctica]|uniref:CRISPR-associated endoribonuclease Cas2 n=1 Tax=Leucothrix arctica TaxID=1481894 RepID=A0A317CSN0_9GAMM|nr:CRISPR-associated endonuclease Cas2 [Leucothrix arctica]PWQ99332.1 CRISPR-associated protein Cas2 [Leucothrix arctica]